MSDKRDQYIILSSCFMIQAIGVGTLVSFGVFFNSFVAEFGWSRALISGASSLAIFMSGVSAILIGYLIDRHGPQHLMRGAGILLGTGIALTSLTSNIWQLYVFYGLIFGIGQGCVDVIALTTTARWFKSSRGVMTALVKVGTGVGQFFIPLSASLLILSYGWRQAYVVMGITIICLLLVVAQLLKRKVPATLVPLFKPAKKTAVFETRNLSTRQALKTAQFWIISSSYGLVVFCLFVILVHLVPHAGDLGFSHTLSAGLISTLGAMSIIGRLASGFTLDRFGSKPIMVACFVVLIISLLWLQIADQLWMLYVFATIYGIAHGSFFTVISPLIAEVFGLTSHGSLFGIVVCFGTTGGAIGPIVAGQLFDWTNSYTIAFRCIALVSFIALMMLLLLKPIKEDAQLN